MPDDNLKHLYDECRRMEEDSLYTAETHYITAEKARNLSLWLKFIPAAVAAMSGTLIILEYPTWIAWLSILSGLSFALTTILDVDRRKNEHTVAAKEFTVLKHEARSLYETFYHEMKREEFAREVRRLRDKYNSLIGHTPQTAEKEFEKARKKIKSGRHTPDFKLNE